MVRCSSCYRYLTTCTWRICLKVLINHEFFSWLDDENIELWNGVDTHITASEKHILIFHWVGNAYRKLLRPENDAFRWRLFEKTGRLIPAERSDDEKISPESLFNYKEPPPIALEAIATPAVALPTPKLFLMTLKAKTNLMMRKFLRTIDRRMMLTSSAS